MSTMPGFTAEAALFGRAQHHYGIASIARSSGTVKPAFRFATDPHLSWSFDFLLCCLTCPPHTLCVPSDFPWAICQCGNFG